MPKSLYITTAIDYANGSPHIGHAYEKVLADVIARSKRMEGHAVYFLTGLDEHGQKVQQSAEKQGLSPLALCDTIAQAFQGLCQRLGISHNDFIRTTEDRHKTIVQSITQKLFDEGFIYKAEYTGFYSPRAEQFLQEKDKVDGEWPEIFGDVIAVSESNYFLKISPYQDWLKDYIQGHPDFIFPKNRAKQVLEFLKEPIKDLCISRPKSRLSWGISLPFDEDFVIYVWLDALINYISAIGYGEAHFENYWPATYQVIGKDILIPAHAVYWTILLKILGLELPQCILVHGWWLANGDKMSKSKGNVVDPLSLIESFSPDAFRYFLMREMHVGQDSNFSEQLFLSRYQAELGNDLGNLLSRLLHMLQAYSEGKVPPVEAIDQEEQQLRQDWEALAPKVLQLYQNFDFSNALEQLFGFIKGLNRYAELRAPWKLAKSEDPKDKQALYATLAHMAEGLRLSAVFLSPIMPQIAEKIQTLLGAAVTDSFKDAILWSHSLAGKAVGEKTILFPRVDKANPT
jgi:methionyl-tRNA synthetase